MTKYSVEGEFDAGWSSYWPPDDDDETDEQEQHTDESAESDTEDDSITEGDNVSDTHDTHDTTADDWDIELPEYATEPEQGEMKTEGKPMTKHTREQQAIQEELAAAGYPDLLSEKQTDAIVATRLNPEKTLSELAEGNSFSPATCSLARQKYKAVIASTDEELEALFDGLTHQLQRALVANLHHPEKSSREIAELGDFSSATARRASRFLAPAFEGYGIDRLITRAGIESIETADTTSDSDNGNELDLTAGSEVQTDKEKIRAAVQQMDGRFGTTDIQAAASTVPSITRKHLRELEGEGVLSYQGQEGKRGENQWAVAGDGPDSGGVQGQTQENASDSDSPDAAVVDVAFKLGRGTYHLLDGDGETYCTHVYARPEVEDSALIRTHRSDAENAGLARCEQCNRISAAGNKTRDELIGDISEALPTPARDSVTFSKAELAEILKAVQEAD